MTIFVALQNQAFVEGLAAMMTDEIDRSPNNLAKICYEISKGRLVPATPGVRQAIVTLGTLTEVLQGKSSVKTAILNHYVGYAQHAQFCPEGLSDSQVDSLLAYMTGKPRITEDPYAMSRLTPVLWYPSKSTDILQSIAGQLVAVTENSSKMLDVTAPYMNHFTEQALPSKDWYDRAIGLEELCEELHFQHTYLNALAAVLKSKRPSELISTLMCRPGDLIPTAGIAAVLATRLKNVKFAPELLNTLEIESDLIVACSGFEGALNSKVV